MFREITRSNAKFHDIYFFLYDASMLPYFSVGLTKVLFWNFEIKIFHNMGPCGAKTSKRYSSLKSLLNFSKTLTSPELFLISPHISTFLIFETLSLRFFTIFFSFSLIWDHMR